MQTVIKHADIYTGEDTIKDGYIRFTKSVLAVGPMIKYQPKATDEQIIDGHQTVIVPGFIDVHSHGGYGIDTMDGDPAKLNEMVHQVTKNEGVTTFFPTTVTQSFENINKAMVAIKKAAAENPVIQGTNLEGPFVSAEYKGAQPEKYIQDPDYRLLDQWNELAGGLVKMITYAPEKPGAHELEQYCLTHNIVPSAGHSSATREQMKHSLASHITHLYNAQRGMRHREPGLTGDALMEDNLYTEIIADGFHVVPDMIRLAYQIKGPDRMELITDSLRAKGMPEGISELGGQKVIVKDHQARLENGHLAGSVLQYNLAFQNIIDFTDCGIANAVKMSSVNQAREFGLTTKGGLTVGKDADLNILDQNLNLKSTYSYGQLVK